MLLDNSAAGVEAHAGAGEVSDHIRAAVEAIEDALEIGLWDTDPLITHAEHRPPTVELAFGLDQERDRTAVRAVLDGVAEEIVEQSLEAGCVPPTADLGQCRFDHDAMALGQRLVVGGGLARQRQEVGRLAAQL